MTELFFRRRFDWRPPERRGLVISFAPGRTYFVRRPCADAALAAGAARLVRARTTKPHCRGDGKP